MDLRTEGGEGGGRGDRPRIA